MASLSNFFGSRKLILLPASVASHSCAATILFSFNLSRKDAMFVKMQRKLCVFSSWRLCVKLSDIRGAYAQLRDPNIKVIACAKDDMK